VRLPLASQIAAYKPSEPGPVSGKVLNVTPRFRRGDQAAMDPTSAGGASSTMIYEMS